MEVFVIFKYCRGLGFCSGTFPRVGARVWGKVLGLGLRFQGWKGFWLSLGQL